MNAKPITVFLSYASQDREPIEELYEKLAENGFSPWMDGKSILPGSDREYVTKKALNEADFFISCLSSNSVNKRGFVQKELKQALDLWQEKLPEDIYLIPLKLEKCQVPESLKKFQSVDYFSDGGEAKLFKALKMRTNGKAEAEMPLNMVSEITDATTTVQEEIAIKEKTLDVEITLKGDIKDFSEDKRARLLKVLEELLEINDGELKIKKIRKGSVKVTVELSPEQAEKLMWAVKAGMFSDVNIIDAEIRTFDNEMPTEESILPKHKREYDTEKQVAELEQTIVPLLELWEFQNPQKSEKGKVEFWIVVNLGTEIQQTNDLVRHLFNLGVPILADAMILENLQDLNFLNRFFKGSADSFKFGVIVSISRSLPNAQELDNIILVLNMWTEKFNVEVVPVQHYSENNQALSKFKQQLWTLSFEQHDSKFNQAWIKRFTKYVFFNSRFALLGFKSHPQNADFHDDSRRIPFPEPLRMRPPFSLLIKTFSQPLNIFELSEIIKKSPESIMDVGFEAGIYINIFEYLDPPLLELILEGFGYKKDRSFLGS
ncbi:MAG: toll/interleukin-1 receptor domain-containing protein [Calditrichia bacterium]